MVGLKKQEDLGRLKQVRGGGWGGLVFLQVSVTVVESCHHLRLKVGKWGNQRVGRQTKRELQGHLLNKSLFFVL